MLDNNKNAILVPPNNVFLFSNAILKLKDANIYNSIVGSGRTLVEQFSWDKIKYKWINLLK